MPSVAVLPPSPAPTGFAPSYPKMQNGHASPHHDTVADIKAAAKEQVQKVRGASASSLLRAARDQIQLAKAREGSGDLKDALSSLTKAISLTQMFMETNDFKQEMAPGKKGVLTRDLLNFYENEGADLTGRMQRLEAKVVELDHAAARVAEAESTADDPVRKPGGSIADRMRALQNAGLAVSPTKVTSKRLSKDLKLSSLPSLPSTPAVPQTPSFASTSSAVSTPSVPVTPSFASGPLSPDMSRPQRMSLQSLPSPSTSSSTFASTSAASTSVPLTPTFPSGPLSPDASKPQRMSLHALQPPLIPSSNNVSPLASSSTSPSPHTLIPASSFGPPSPTSSTSSSPRMSSRLSLTDFNHNFPSIDEMDEMEGLKLPSAPPLNTLITGSSKYSDHAFDNSPVSTFSKQFPALPIDPGPRPSSTPIPHIDTFNSRPSSPMRSPLLPSVPRKSSNLALNGGQRSPLIPQITPPEKRELPNALFPAILRDYKSKPNFKVLILDVRTRQDFDAEHIKADAVVCIEPTVLLRPNVSADSIETSLAVGPRHESMLFSNRDKFDLIAVCDESSRSMNDSPALMALERAIYEQAFRKILKNIPLLLVGGMSAWRAEFGAEELVRGSAESSSESPNASNGTLSSAAGTASANGIFAPRPSNPMIPLAPLPSPSLASISSGHTRTPAESSTSAAFSSPLLDSTNMGRSVPTVPASDAGGYERWRPNPGTTMTPIPPEIPISSRPVVQERREPPPLARKPAISRPPSNSVSFPSTVPEHTPAHRSSPSLANGIKYPSINHQISPQMSGSSFNNNTMNGFVSLPPQASINPSSLSRRRSDYIDQSQEALAGIHRPSIDYPQLSSQHILRPPPAVAAPSMERQDSRPRVLQHTGPKPPTIQSDYPVTYWPDNQIGMSGLKNLGNTCYMNSTIQCLSATVPFARFFTDGRWKSAVNMVNPMGTKGVLAQAFAGILRDMWQGEMPSLNPLPFRRTVCTFAKQFSGSEQHDSQEFLSVLLDGLHEDLNRVLNKPTIEMTPEREAELEKLPTQLASEQQWQIYRMRDDSLVVDFFQGQYRSRLECMTCHKTSTTYNTFMYLTLPIPTGRGNSKVSLQHCLDAFVKEEVMEKSDAWNCPNCKQLRRATKLLSLSRLPPVLLIHLKRFSVKGHFTEKIETFVDFPLQNLDLTNYMPPPLPPGVGGASPLSVDDPRAQLPPYRYDLYGVTNHFGTLSSGHYTAFISSRGGWMYCDDSRIAPADPKDVVGKPAYILFYKRTKA